MKFIFSSLLMFIIIACSSSTDAPDNEDIFSGIFHQNYAGVLNYEMSGDFTGSFVDDSTNAIVISDESGGGLSFFIFTKDLLTSFTGITNGSALNLSITDTIGVGPGEVHGAIFNDSLLAFAQSGDFVFTKFDKSTLKGSFNGVFAGHRDTVNISGNFELNSASLIK